MEGSARSTLEILVPLVAVLEVERHHPLGFTNITLVSLLQYENTLLPMLVTPLPIVTLLRLMQYMNAPSPILVTLSGMVMLVSLLQSENAEPPMLVNLLFSTKEMLVRLLQPKNA